MKKISEIDEEKLRKVSLFFGKLLLVGLMVRALVLLSPNTYVLESILASVSGSLLNTLGMPVDILGNRITTGKQLFIVNQDCLGWKSIAAFTGLCWASEISDKAKIIIIGSAGLFILNIVRIVTTIYLSASGIIEFEILHLFLWRWGLTGAVLLFWISVMRSKITDM